LHHDILSFSLPEEKMTSRAKWFLCLGLFCFSLSAMAAESTTTARVVSINGSAKLGEQPLQVGQNVAVGEWIRTSASSGVKLLMPDRSVIDIGPNTQFRVQTALADATDGQLEWGSVRASIQKRLEGKTKFRVRTKSSVLSARGTEFAVTSVPKQGTKNQFVDQVTVRSGVVEMQAPGLEKLMLDAGKQVTALAQTTAKGVSVDGRSFKPVDLPPDSLQKTMTVATVSDDTFRQVVVLPNSQADRTPGSEGQPPVGKVAHFGQDALASANLKAANDPEGQHNPGAAPPLKDSFFRPRDHSQVNGLNNVAGSNIEKILNDGVNVTVVFKL